MKINYKNLILLFSLCINAFICSYNFYFNNEPEPIKITEIEYVNVPTNRHMTEWEMFTMALIEVESRYDSTAVSSKGAKGYFQFMPIYIKEVNDKHNTNFTIKDASHLETSYIIFDLMQQAHNKDYDIKKALKLHNGDHGWYEKTVMNKYKEIEKREHVRNRLIELWDSID